MVMVEACGVGAGLADVPPGDGRGTPEAGGWLPAHPAHRPSKATANATLTARTRQRSGSEAVGDVMPERYHARLDTPPVVRPCPLGRWSVPRRPRGATALADPLKAGLRPYVGAVAEREAGLVLLDGVQLEYGVQAAAQAAKAGDPSPRTAADRPVRARQHAVDLRRVHPPFRRPLRHPSSRGGTADHGRERLTRRCVLPAAGAGRKLPKPRIREPVGPAGADQGP